MEDDLFSLVNLRDMEVIDINTGTKLGFIKDLKINCDEHRIISIVLPSQTTKMSLFSKNEDVEVPWEDIKKIGVDVILIDGKKLSEKD
ncbi:MAG TPA: YlmC/YmxH family sporulation protein [Clostridium sp.]|jgi:YlmC/YmxH family sporulation protein|uniref:YlmC/YmxH family sporulation protein n=1 Tax=Clostridium lapidicellarium TaxID=3240931 RepID=A0ABV4DU76_9CLOT|nr:YlmC/YmxH family sporulation protein [uncultured Clostridium sp.]NLU07462.1 YlmC/YmxH family sporulation protein [Clostridiales bacterium]HBC97012.1 YlmC/YmxH family sporulation protein [Clostridium sp.]